MAALVSVSPPRDTVSTTASSRFGAFKSCHRALPKAIRTWNNNHVQVDYNPAFLDAMESLSTLRQGHDCCGEAIKLFLGVALSL